LAGAKPKLYYNSACPVCRTGIEQQRAKMDESSPEGSDAIAWCDIAASPEAAHEIDRSVDQIRHSLHMVDENGRLLVGADVAIAVWLMTPGRRWLGRLVGLPGIRQLARWGYNRFADRLFAWNKRQGRW
jgi:predicted DCC family thiol-disulfide oxidoreductase YuxK